MVLARVGELQDAGEVGVELVAASMSVAACRTSSSAAPARARWPRSASARLLAQRAAASRPRRSRVGHVDDDDADAGLAVVESTGR